MDIFSLAFMVGNEYLNQPYSKYFMDDDVNSCQLDVYLMLISLLDWYDEEELLWIIDNLDLATYRKLSKEKQDYIKGDAKELLALRKERMNNE